MRDLKTIRLTPRSKRLKIEAPGCIIVISHDLETDDGWPCVSIAITPDGERFANRDGDWRIADGESALFQNVRVVKFPHGAPL